MNTFGEPNFVLILIVLAVLVVMFLVVRELLCWYWKINQAVLLLTEIRDLLAGKGSSAASGTAKREPHL